ncbi:MAG: hypothetical protein ACKOE5_13735 [Cytophagales bacterium]
MSKLVYCLAIVFLFPLLSVAQKVKYKDLVVWLNARQFEKAEPFLKRYLKETNDNPSAFLFMGILFQEKAMNNDVLKNTDQIVTQCDSAVMFLDKAYNMVTEKELRKNDDYYQMYSRRDLRTGEFGVKLSDVRLDLENRVTSLKDRKDKVKIAKNSFLACERQYGSAVKIFVDLRSSYGSDKEFLLRSNDAMGTNLEKLIVYFDSTMASLNTFKAALKKIGKTPYNPIVDIREIANFKQDGSTDANFLEDDLKLWNYKQWATTALEKIKTEIIPLRESLIAYDISLNKLRDKCVRDSVSIHNELRSLPDNLVYAQAKKYDADPLPLAMFDMKRAELEYLSDKIRFKPLRDSINLKIRLNALKIELTNVKKIDSIATSILERNMDNELLNFEHFVSNAFGNNAVLISHINSMQGFAQREKQKKEIEWESTMQASKWLISGTDSIPIFNETNRDLPFKPLAVVEDKFTVGLLYKDSLATGYFYSITPSRVPDQKVVFAIDQPNFKKRHLPMIKNLNASIGQGQIYYVLIYSEVKVKDKFPITLAKIYKTDGLAWVYNYKLDLKPAELNFSADTGQLSIKLTGLSGESKVIVIDKNGKQL